MSGREEEERTMTGGSKDEKAGVQLGELGLLTANGFEPLHAIPAEVYRRG